MQISLCRTINNVPDDDTNSIMITEHNIGGDHHNRPDRGNYSLGRIGAGSTLPRHLEHHPWGRDQRH